MGRYSRSRSPGGGGDQRIQKLVDERQECRRNREFDRADQIRDELRDMGVLVDDAELSWSTTGGLSGRVNNGGSSGGGSFGGGGVQRRDGDWDCDACGKMNFAYRDVCFACGAPRRDTGGRDDRGGGGGHRSSRNDDRYDDRDRRDRRDYDDRDRRYDRDRRRDSPDRRRRRDDSRDDRRYR